MDSPIMLFIRKYKRHKWEYKIVYIDPFTKKTRATRQRGFSTKVEAEMAAVQILRYLKISID